VVLRRHLLLSRDYWQFQDLLARNNELSLEYVGSAVCRAFRARALFDRVMKALLQRPDIILARQGQRYRRM
jgi:hypothetical protein